MTTTMRMLPVRTTSALRGLIDQVGPVNPATRALLILGADAAGLDLHGVERELAALLAADLHDEVRQALAVIYARLTGNGERQEYQPVPMERQERPSIDRQERPPVSVERQERPPQPVVVAVPQTSPEEATPPAPAIDPDNDPFANVGIDVNTD
ncbi:MAG: hypothetical protein HC828_06605 [Blastochloris sp.]|nr:hypothetical protein [Blastochloris sp.]